MSALFIPTLSHWLLGNRWSGSLGRASYYVTPRQRQEGEQTVDEVYAEAWTGPICYEQCTPERTAVCMLADKEEIGSEGVTGLRSAALAHFLTSLCENRGADYKTCFAASDCLSADVGGAYDPCYAEAYEAGNSAYLNHGVAVMKYTGARGKSGSSDASAELLAKLARIFRENDVVWQTGEYGIMDLGGGGTMAPLPAQYGMETADCGIPLLSMHAPYELASKADVYEASRAYAAFLASDKDIEQYQ